LLFPTAYALGGYGVATFHRPSNVDARQDLERLVRTLCAVADKMRVIFPVHPRTYAHLEQHTLLQEIARTPGLLLTQPLGYLEFMALVRSSTCVMTDSGGIQEETTVLGIPCLTVRDNTERPITISEGTNKLIKIDALPGEVAAILKGRGKKGKTPPLWDGKTARRIVTVIERIADHAFQAL